MCINMQIPWFCPWSSICSEDQNSIANEHPDTSDADSLVTV